MKKGKMAKYTFSHVPLSNKLDTTVMYNINRYVWLIFIRACDRVFDQAFSSPSIRMHWHCLYAIELVSCKTSSFKWLCVLSINDARIYRTTIDTECKFMWKQANKQNREKTWIKWSNKTNGGIEQQQWALNTDANADCNGKPK